ncbi:MAG: YcxB family protein [Candidatus Izemoplasma sp.]
MDEVSVEYKVNKEEFISYYFWDKYIRKHSSTLILVVADIVFLGMGTMAIINNDLGMIAYSLLCIIIFSLFPLFYKKRLGKVYDGDEFYGDKIAVKISDKGIEVKKGDIDGLYEFSEMYKIIETKQFIYIGYSKARSSYIIKSKYTEEQLTTLREILKRNVDLDKLKLIE